VLAQEARIVDGPFDIWKQTATVDVHLIKRFQQSRSLVHGNVEYDAAGKRHIPPVVRYNLSYSLGPNLQRFKKNMFGEKALLIRQSLVVAIDDALHLQFRELLFECRTELCLRDADVFHFQSSD
jgi:hypothetical protein